MLFFLRALSLLLLLTACASGHGPASVVVPPEPITEAAVAPPVSIGESPALGSSDPVLQPLEAALDEYLRIEAAGGWAVLPVGPTLELGAQGERVTALRHRLKASGDLTSEALDLALFDDELAAAVRHFQARHGLRIDGIVGPETTEALNVPVTQRAAMLRLNLARVAGEQRVWGPRYVEVNIPSASYRFVENGQIVLEGPAIVGRPSWPTPRQSGIIERLEFNPYWTVPTNIARLELWPKIRRDAGYLTRNHMRIINGQIRQDPGPGNPLGVVKFIFDNPYQVYLHDTNNRALFEKPKRFLSHGCMRVSHAVELAKQLLKDDPNWPGEKIYDAIASGRNIRIDLLKPIPIHVVYDTAWIDSAGTLEFRDDIYGLDRAFLATGESAASPAPSACGPLE